MEAKATARPEPSDRAVILAWLVIILAFVLAATPWWRASLALVPVGVLIAGLEALKETLLGGIADILGWTDAPEDDID